MLILVVAVIITLFFSLGLDQYLNLEWIKGQKNELTNFYQMNRGLTLGLFFGVYVLVTALSLPGAAILTLAGGAFFGLLTGVIIVSFASSIGATLAFLTSRFLLRDWVQERFKEKLQTINQGVEKEGSFYLFTLRLVPLFPFFLINLVMGLTPIRIVTFYLVSQVGMLAGTVVYVFTGTQLAELTSITGILSPNLIFAFTLIGLMPLTAKKTVDYFRSKKIYQKFQKPKRFDYNMVVIGAGSGGLVSAYIAAVVKAKVLLIEKHKMGGDCLNTGCVPSKALIRSAKMLSYAKRAEEFGFKKTDVEFNFADVMERVQNVIKKIEPHDSVERYTQLGVECLQGEARILDPWRVEVGGEIFKTKNIVIATGARPLVPPIPGLDQIPFLTSDTLWNIRKLPKRFLVLGGGPIGCELAQCFSRLGSEVSIIERAPQLLIREDDEISKVMTDHMKDEGIKVLTGHTAKEFLQDGDLKQLICEVDGGEVTLEFDEVLVALGRKANVDGFGLKELGVETTPVGTIAADELLRTNYPNIYVCGDVAGPYQFTHTAAHQAWYVAVNALFSPFKTFKADYRVIPWATFTDPEVARVGMNEKDAKAANIPYEVTLYGIDDLDRAIADSEDRGCVKVLTPPGKDKILGVTIVGAHAGDLISEFVIAMKHNLGLNKILGTIHIYPTMSESNKYLAGNWKKNHSPEGVLNRLEKFHSWRRGGNR
ncbi:MAG: FAD-dependent oxidoreductase [Proteobacteria bacterium]|nr:FAD-dependent oxidoreductase [Pseudomonadota bacterium]